MENLIEIPWQDLQADTLASLEEEFVTRDGTDYGEQEVLVQKKVDQVVEGIKRKHYLIVFDQESESVHIITKQQWQEYQNQSLD